MEKIKFGIFGLGRGSGFYDGVAANNGEVVAVCDFNEKRLEKFKTTFSGAVDAVFKCGYVEYVSRRCLSQIKRRFEQK